MIHSYDVAIIGAGAMGSAAAYQLSKTGLNILVLDKFHPPHDLGSSHGQSRIIREAYFESPQYVPLIQQAYNLWQELEAASGRQLLLKTGGLMLGNKEQQVFKGASNSARQHHIKYELLDETALNAKFPVWKTNKETVALYDYRAGILFPEACIQTQLHLSENRNMDFRFNEPVSALQFHGDFTTIVTGKSSYSAKKVIVSNGAWIQSLLPELPMPLQVKRQVLFWFRCPGDSAGNFLPSRFPIFIWEYAPGKMFYGFPDLGTGIKIAIHHQGKLTAADTIDRTVHAGEIESISSLLSNHFEGPFEYHDSKVCMYTNTPDENFILDVHPHHRHVIVVSACSGHGFKFSSAIGKLLSEMVTEVPLSFDIGMFALDRKF